VFDPEQAALAPERAVHIRCRNVKGTGHARNEPVEELKKRSRPLNEKGESILRTNITHAVWENAMPEVSPQINNNPFSLNVLHSLDRRKDPKGV
jgi:hypothetical protein